MESTSDFRNLNEFCRVMAGKVAELTGVVLELCLLVTLARLYSTMDLKCRFSIAAPRPPHEIKGILTCE